MAESIRVTSFMAGAIGDETAATDRSPAMSLGSNRGPTWGDGGADPKVTRRPHGGIVGPGCRRDFVATWVRDPPRRTPASGVAHVVRITTLDGISVPVLVSVPRLAAGP